MCFVFREPRGVKLNRSQRSQIRVFDRAGVPKTLLAKTYHVSDTTVCRYVTNNLRERGNLDSDDEHLAPGDLVLTPEMRQVLVNVTMKLCHFFVYCINNSMHLFSHLSTKRESMSKNALIRTSKTPLRASSLITWAAHLTCL